jgi:hypothetical protein
MWTGAFLFLLVIFFHFPFLPSLPDLSLFACSFGIPDGQARFLRYAKALIDRTKEKEK